MPRDTTPEDQSKLPTTPAGTVVPSDEKSLTDATKRSSLFCQPLYTAPIQYGLYDMGGNVWQWCEDLMEPGDAQHVLRGGSWNNHDSNGLLSSIRYRGARDYRSLN